ncbi:uncharacterized protein LOC116339901 isoform X2 [Contarinia nasturtii]|uniref:uncharacterized protein LOC116339901 isoform X2 n=1 Tax=Contarinia nasturtii TaxID=265458 RepID=UPI0012D4768E|nr:uncharacterized protein LOC116339901 isoform X2 [Contarinia nasturtii]
MKIPELPEVLFDEFPSDNSTKICIFTQAQYPIPDCSQYVGNVLFFCNETTYCFLGSFPKPEENQWMRIDDTIINGLKKSFTITCLPTGNALDSVMILLHTDEKPNQLTLYTGQFTDCRNVLLSSTIARKKTKISDIYLDNTMSGSLHEDIGQNYRTCEDIKNVIDEYPDCRVILQTEPLESLDVLVELAARYQIDVRLNGLQQLFIHRTKHKHLFKYNSEALSHIKDVNNEFKFDGQPKIYIQNYQALSLDTYKTLYQRKKIINIRLIARNDSDADQKHDGLIYITHFSHAGSYTLANLLQMIEPKRVHPNITDEVGDDSMLKIPEEILNTDCRIVNNDISREFLEVTINDITRAARPPDKHRTNRSFLNPSTLEEDNESLSTEKKIDVKVTDNVVKIEILGGSDDCIVISDDESDCLELKSKTVSRKRSLSSREHSTVNSKIFRPNGKNISDTSSARHKDRTSILYNQSDSTYRNNSDSNYSESCCELIFPD